MPAAAQGGELTEGRNILYNDVSSSSSAKLFGKGEPQHVPVSTSGGVDAVEGGDPVEEVIVQGFLRAVGPTTVLDDDGGVAHR